MDLRTRTSLFCGAVALAIGISILLRGRIRRPQALGAGFSIDMGLWYLAQWLYQWNSHEIWAKSTAVLALLLPQFALHLFESLLPRVGKRSVLLRVAGSLLVPLLVLSLSPFGRESWARALIFIYVFGLLSAGLGSLYRRGERSGSRATQKRIRFLVLIGALAALLVVADFLWFIGAPLPPIGAVLTVVFLYVLVQSLNRERLVDLYDLFGHLVLNALLAFCLAGIFYVFVVLFGGFETMYLGAILAAIVILVLFEPLRQKMELTIQTVFSSERVDLERAVARVRVRLVHVLEVAEMVRVVCEELEQSRRATGAALYLRDPLGVDFPLAKSFGPPPPLRLEAATARSLLDHLSQHGRVVLERVAVEADDSRRRGHTHKAEVDERLLGAAEALGPHRLGVCLGIRSDDGSLLGLLALSDDRVTDAFSSDEVALLESMAVQMGVVIDNSRQYRHMQERDRLAALGQMAAGLAHEIKNPLGAIKGAAQLLGEEHPGTRLDPSSREFIDIILEEVERLDGVVGSVLDYARPSQGNPGQVEVNGVVSRTLQLLSKECKENLSFETDLAETRLLVRADPEQLRQVLINLVRNAMQAMNHRGKVLVRTLERHGYRPGWSSRDKQSDWVEIAVLDQGPGMNQSILDSLFVPFFTTKQKGTGLGLAISQRLTTAMGGRILVASEPGVGSTFSIVLPAAVEP